MEERTDSRVPEAVAAVEERLDSWKEIAAYLGRGVRTVQRWEQQEGLPVRRHLHDKRGTVFALRTEIDRWLSEREAAGFSAGVSRPTPRRGASLWIVAAAAVATIVVAFAVTRPAPEAAQDWSIRPLTADRGHEHHPAISPDGSRIVYTWHPGEYEPPRLYVQPIDAGPRRRLTERDQIEVAPAWSPDGRWIAALVGQREGPRNVVLISPETGAQRALFEVEHTAGGPFITWSPDSSTLLLAASMGGGTLKIFAYRITDGRITDVVDDLEGRVFGAPAVSPQGDQVAFSQWNSDSVSEIFLVEVDSDFRPRSEPRALTDSGSTSVHPVFTADGKEILYRSGWWASRGLWRVAVDGGEPRRSIPAAEGVEEFAYHGGIGLLAFSRISATMDVWSQPMCDCPERRERLIESTLHDLNAKISPDGTKIAFASNRSGRFQVWTADADGQNARRTTDFGETMTGTPRWSPDSRLLAFDSRPDGHSDIFVVPAEGGEPRRLTDDPADDVTPSWSASGERVYFGSDRSGDYQIWFVPAAGGEARQVTTEGGFTAVESPDGRTLYVARRNGIKSSKGADDGHPGTSLWRQSPDGGKQTLVAERIWDWSKFVPVDDGVYYVVCEDLEPCSVWFYRASDGTTTRTARTAPHLEVGFDVAADRSRILYSTLHSGESDLVLVEGFR